MGFGLATLGYGFMLTYNAGGGIIAGILLAYGFYLASRLNKRFLVASISALFLIPHSVLLLLYVTQILDESSMMLASAISKTIFYCAWLSVSYFYLTAVKEIAIENNDNKFKNKAMNRLYFTVFFLVIAIFMIVFYDLVTPGMMNFWIVMQYIVIAVNFLFLHTCFLMITTEAQDKKDRKYFEDQEKKQQEKRKRRDEK